MPLLPLIFITKEREAPPLVVLAENQDLLLVVACPNSLHHKILRLLQNDISCLMR